MTDMTPEELAEALELAEEVAAWCEGMGGTENTPFEAGELHAVARPLLYYCKWKPIETAPKDGLFLTWSHERKRMFTVFRDGPDNNIVVDGVRGKRWRATHWLPLPPAPEGE